MTFEQEIYSQINKLAKEKGYIDAHQAPGVAGVLIKYPDLPVTGRTLYAYIRQEAPVEVIRQIFNEEVDLTVLRNHKTPLPRPVANAILMIFKTGDLAALRRYVVGVVEEGLGT